MARRSFLGVLAAMALAGALGARTAYGASTQLFLSQGDAFSILGHSCGGIQEQVYATGFGAAGLPTGDVYMQTRCGGSGRGGGYKTTTYAAWASVMWDWFGNTRSFARLDGAAEGISESFSAEDTDGDRIYNMGKSAFLETTSPPLTAPAAPTGVSAELSSIEAGEEEPPILRLTVSWTPAPETAWLVTSSTVTATPVGSTAPVLSATVNGPGTSAVLQPLERHTTYSITVTNTDAEGTSQASSPVEVTSLNEDGEGGGEGDAGEGTEGEAKEPPLETKGEEPPAETKTEEPPVEPKEAPGEKKEEPAPKKDTEEPAPTPPEGGGCPTMEIGGAATAACGQEGTTQPDRSESPLSSSVGSGAAIITTDAGPTPLSTGKARAVHGRHRHRRHRDQSHKSPLLARR